MKVLIIDMEKTGLPFAMKAKAAGHDVLLWMPTPTSGERSKIGQGLVEVTTKWEPHMAWADLVVVTDNCKYGAALEPYYTKGFPIVGANQEAASWELDREVGCAIFEKCGVETLPFKTFTSYDTAAEYVRKEGKIFVSKPWGGNPDKSLSYVSKSPADMIFKLGRWKADGLKAGKFMLQECIEGAEMAVGGWFGPSGWCEWRNESWEEKRLLNDGLGPNTGEMGTVMRYVKKSALFDAVLLPCTDLLAKAGYVGYADVNCMVGEDGTPWPLEFTMRFGWPHYNLAMHLHDDDPAAFLSHLLEGKDRLCPLSDICVGVVMLTNYPAEDQHGYPIAGLTASRRKSFALSSGMMEVAPVMQGDKVVDRPTYCTAADYVGIALGLGETVEEARESAYKVAWEIDWPTSRLFRTDIGCRLEEGLPALQKHGFAKGLKYD